MSKVLYENGRVFKSSSRQRFNFFFPSSSLNFGPFSVDITMSIVVKRKRVSMLSQVMFPALQAISQDIKWRLDFPSTRNREKLLNSLQRENLEFLPEIREHMRNVVSWIKKFISTRFIPISILQWRNWVLRYLRLATSSWCSWYRLLLLICSHFVNSEFNAWFSLFFLFLHCVNISYRLIPPQFPPFYQPKHHRHLHMPQRDCRVSVEEEILEKIFFLFFNIWHALLICSQNQ